MKEEKSTAMEALRSESPPHKWLYDSNADATAQAAHTGILNVVLVGCSTDRQSVGTRRLSARDRQKAEPLPYSVMKISAWLVASGTLLQDI